MNNNVDMFAKSTNPVNYGVNREEAESIIQKFLENKNYSVLAVGGKWGVGKTHLVINVLDKHHQNYYLYASVFGISSIEHLKARIFANYQKNLKHKIKPINNVVEFFNRNFGRLEKTPKLDFGLSGSLLAIGSDLLLEIFFNLNVNGNSIICIDDLERKSQLPLKDIFGFVEYLVQDFKCKIILIYNEDELDEDSQTALETYREKVIDKEFNLNPTVEENLDFIFKESPDVNVIKEVFKKAGTNNIRVIRKTKWLIDEFITLMKDWEESLRHQIIINSILINLEKLDADYRKNFPSIKDIISTLSKDPSEYMGSDQKTNDTRRFELAQEKIKAKGRTQLLNQYFGYISLEELDEIIIKLVYTSFFDRDNFNRIGIFFNEREKKSKFDMKIRDIQNLCYNSFADNEKQISDEIINYLKNHHLDLSISEFDQIQLFASKVGQNINDYEKSLVKEIIQRIFDEIADDNVTAFNEMMRLQQKLAAYPDLYIDFKEKEKQYAQKLDINTIFQKIMNSDSESLLIFYMKLCQEYKNLSEYCKWLEEENQNVNLVKKLLQGNIPLSKEYLKTDLEIISQNLETAIRILAKKSELNKIRAKDLYNIDINNPPHSENP